jgi:hypothetical protein
MLFLGKFRGQVEKGSVDFLFDLTVDHEIA